MSTPALTEALSALRIQLQSAHLPEDERMRLQDLLETIETEMADPSSAAAHHELSNWIAQFEAEHPTLTTAFQRVVASLSAMGL